MTDPSTGLNDEMCDTLMEVQDLMTLSAQEKMEAISNGVAYTFDGLTTDEMMQAVRNGVECSLPTLQRCEVLDAIREGTKEAMLKIRDKRD